MNSLELRSIRKNFGNVEVIRDVSLTCEDGEFLVLVGPSGCGKSTVLRMIAGLESPSGGDILIGGERMNEVSAADRGCAMVFQSYALYPHMTVYANMAFGLENTGMPAAQIRPKVEKAATMLRLDGLLERKPTQLSGGQRQRVAIGRAIVREPKIFLFDEPLSNLDAELRVSMRTELRELHDRLRATMVYVTHDQVEAMSMADRIVVLRDGRVEQIGSPRELYERPANTFVAGFIGSPRMNLMDAQALRALKGWEAALPADAHTVGVRPEHWATAAAAKVEGKGEGVALKVTGVEFLGGQSLVQGTLGEDIKAEALLAEAPPLSRGDPLRLRVLPRHLHVFDAAGQRIASGVTSMTPWKAGAWQIHPGGASVGASGGASVSLDDGGSMTLRFLSDTMARVTMRPAEGFREPRTWSIAPEGDVPWQGRARDDDAQGFGPAPAVRVDAKAGTLATAALHVCLGSDPLRLQWSTAAGQVLCADRSTSAYLHERRTGGLRHYVQRDPGDRYYGLGDKTGPLNLSGRRLRTVSMDALGYDPEHGDPLYKHWPFLLVRAASGAWYGIYYDTLAACTFDLGQEHDNYHGFYRYVEIDDGDLDYYLMVGATPAEVIAQFLRLVGGTALPPRWSLGFGQTAMGLADAPDAQAQLESFIQRMAEHRVPVSSFHYGSGYSSRGIRRYVFTWNRSKFPDPKSLNASFHAHGLKIVANIKPALLDDHPAWAEVAAQGGFVHHAGDKGRKQATGARTLLGRHGRPPRLHPPRHGRLVAATPGRAGA